MANLIEIPIMNPLRFVGQTDKLASDITGTKYKAFNPSFNSRQFDDDFFVRSIKYYETKESFFQPYQQADIIRGLFYSQSTTTANHTIRLLDKFGNVFVPKSVTVTQQSGTFNGYKAYTFEFSLWDVPEGLYYVQIRYDFTASVYSYIIAEGIDVKRTHSKSVRFDYSNTYNDQDVIWFTSSFIFQLRLNGTLTKFTPSSDFTNYEDQPKNMKIVSGIPFRGFELALFKVPDWMADKVERMFINDTIRIDGKLWQRDNGAKLESKDTSLNPLKDYTIKLREAENKTSVVHNLNSAIMGDMPQTKYFWVEQMTMDSVVTTIRQGFEGKQNFLDYLNSNVHTNHGYWGEDAKNQLVFYPNEDYTIANTWVLTPVNVLKYGMKLEIDGAGDFEVDVVGPGGGGFYAVKWGGGIASTNKTTLPATPTVTNIANSWSATYKFNMYLYASDYISIADSATTINILSIDCDIPPSCTYFNPFYNANNCMRFLSNPFNFVTALALFDIQGFNLPTGEIDNMCRWIYDCLTRFSTSANIYLQSQIVPAPPSLNFDGMKRILSAIAKRVTNISTD